MTIRSRGYRRSLFEEPPQPKRACDHLGCAEAGEYRAPRARDRLNEYYWFCLDHVREYNARWDYYAGMTSEEIEEAVRRDTIWQRETWPMGSRAARRFASYRIQDPFGFLGGDEEEEEPPFARRHPRARGPEEEAMRVLDLEGPLTMDSLKARYKELVKRHHPDANNGDKAAEERFKRINQAYNTLRATLNA